MDPLCAADKLGDLAAGPGQCFGDLHAAGATANNAPACAGIGDAVVPPRGVELGARKLIAAGDVGEQRLVQKAGGADEDVGDFGLAAGCLDVPAAVADPAATISRLKRMNLGKPRSRATFLW